MSQERTRRTSRRVRPPTVGEIFTALSLTFFERWGRSLARSFEFERLFERAGLNIHPVKYASETIALTIFSAIFSVTGFVLTFLFMPLNIVQLILGLMIAVMIPIMVFVYRLTKPYMMISSRKNSVESELPFFMAYVSTMARGGYSLEKLIERVTAKGFQRY